MIALVTAVAVVAAACTGEDAAEPGDENAPQHQSVARGPGGQPEWFRRACALPPEQLRRLRNGFYEGRSQDVMYVAKNSAFFNGFAHSGPQRHIQEIPFVLYGPGFVPAAGAITASEEVTSADLAHTFAELLDFELPGDRAGRPVTEALLPEAERPVAPRLLVTVVWDGGGWNVLRRWPDQWPNLRSLIEQGVSIEGATLGSSPSSTPPIHATIGTGTFPSDHGIIDLPQRDGGEVRDSWDGDSPERLDVPTLADLYDLSLDNEPKIGMFGERAWHVGMIGHGSALAGGDNDIAVLTDKESYGDLTTNEDFYSVPPGLEDEEAFRLAIDQVDMEDGRRDGYWMGNDILSTPTDSAWTPAWAIYQTEIIERLLTEQGFGADEVPDLFYVNYKQIDHVAHRWTMDAPEMPEALRHADQELGRLVESLDRIAGAGNWALALTADHGTQPIPPGGWKIDQSDVTEAVAEHFGVKTGDLVQQDRSTGLWLDLDFMAERGISASAIASFIDAYTLEQDITEGEEAPDAFGPNDRLFAAAFPTSRLDAIWECAQRRKDS